MATINESALSPMDILTIMSVFVIGLCAVTGMVNEKYKDTFVQGVGLALMTGMSAIIILQYLTRGEPTTNAFGAMLVGVAIYGVGTVIKHISYQRRARDQKRRLHDA